MNVTFQFHLFLLANFPIIRSMKIFFSLDPLTSHEAYEFGSQTLNQGDRVELQRFRRNAFVTLPTPAQHRHTCLSPYMFPCVPFPSWRLTGNQSVVIRWTCCQLQSSFWLSTEGQPGTRLQNHAHRAVRVR